MGRTLKRVPLDFDWPMGKIWPGYMFSLCNEMEDYFKNETLEDTCDLCKQFAGIMGYEISAFGCPILPTMDPPTGDGYQMWETTTEGSPMSPVFSTLDELCAWLEETDASWFGKMGATAGIWKRALVDGDAGSMIMIPPSLRGEE